MDAVFDYRISYMNFVRWSFGQWCVNQWI